MTKPPAMPEPLGWYVVNNIGMATLCADKQDATQVAVENSIQWPNLAPHRAMQLCDAGALQSAQPAEVSDERAALAEQLRNIANGVRICGVSNRRFVGDRLDEIARAILALRPAQQATPDAIREHLEGVASRASTGEQFNAFKWVIDTAFESLDLLPAKQATPEPSEQWETSPPDGETWETSPMEGEKWETSPMAKATPESVGEHRKVSTHPTKDTK